jgi:hypothetical protein
MNLFGHAVVASWHSPDPWHGLGAMLPDLVGIAGGRHPTPRSGAVRAGVALHHATDAAFHASPDFVRLCGRAMERLQADGLSRGAARAAAHVGIELLLDGELGGDTAGAACFRDALALFATRGSELHDVMAWPDAADAGRLREVAARLAEADIPHGYRPPEAVAARLHRILARRPRLSFDEERLPAVGSWTAEAQHQVRDALPGLLRGLGPVR